MRITIDDIPPDVEKALRSKAEAEGKTINEVALEALQAAARVLEREKKRDFSGVVGTWVEDPLMEQVRNAHEQVDPGRWK